MFDDHYGNHPSCRFEPQPKLLLKRRKQGGCSGIAILIAVPNQLEVELAFKPRIILNGSADLAAQADG